MIEGLLESLQTYYGLDWIALILGQMGCWMITQQNRWGFVLSIISCIFGFRVAFTSLQYGFVAHNLILVFMMVRGFKIWSPQNRMVLQAAE